MTTLTSPDGTPIAYDRTGDGPAIVLVDGALGTRAADAALAARLAPRLSVLTYDRRGRGDSGNGSAYAVERELEDLRVVIDAAGGSAALYGTSSGGNLALLAAAQGLPVSKLVLWEPNFLVDDSRPPLPGDYVEQLDELVAADRRGDAVEYFMTAAVGVPAEFAGPMRQMPFWPSMEAVAHTLSHDGRIVDGFALRPERLAAVTVPVLVVDGGQTPWMSSGADALADALPDGRRQTLAGQSHDVAADSIAPVVADFVAA